MNRLKEKKVAAEKLELQDLIRKHNGSTSAIAEELGYADSTVFRKMQKHGLLPMAALARAKASQRKRKKKGDGDAEA